MKTRTTLLAGAAFAVLALGTTAASAQETTTTWRGAPQFQNDTLTFKVRGRVYFDFVSQDVDGAGTGTVFSATNTPDFEANNFRNRTARLGVEGTWNSVFAYKAEATIQNGAANWEDLQLEYRPTETQSVIIGNFKTNGLESINSSRYNVFMERGSYENITQTGRVFNVMYKQNGANYTAAAAISGGSINDADIAQNDERFGVNGRVTFAPIDRDDFKIHVGGWARYRNHNGEGAFNYSARPNTNFGQNFLTTGAIGDSDTTFAGEFAAIYKSFSVQAEYADIKVNRFNPTPAAATFGQDGNIRSGYAFISWFPTGEMRRYEANRGEFNRTRILNPVTAGGWGAVELGLRYEIADATDVAFFPPRPTPVAPIPATLNPRAGRLETITFGVNYYPFPYVRFMANYTVGEFDGKLAAGTENADVDTFQLRAQFDF